HASKLWTKMTSKSNGWTSSQRFPRAVNPPWRSPNSFIWLLAYFGFNLALTIYNKVVLAGNFPFPYTLTAVHCFSGAVGSSLCLERGIFNQARLTKRENVIVILFSMLYTINIIVSNVSLYWA